MHILIMKGFEYNVAPSLSSPATSCRYSSPLLDSSTLALQREPFNFTPMAVNSISSGSPHVRPKGRTCGEPDEIKKNTHPKIFTALFRERTWRILL